MPAEDMLSSHQVHHPEIEPDRARPPLTARWALDDIVIIPSANLTLRGAAYYERRMVKQSTANGGSATPVTGGGILDERDDRRHWWTADDSRRARPTGGRTAVQPAIGSWNASRTRPR